MEIAELFSENLERLMKERGWNQSETAKRSGLTRPHIGLLLRGERQPTVTALEKIANAFGLEAWQMIVKGSAASEDVTRLVRAYQHADDDGREALLRLAELAATR